MTTTTETETALDLGQAARVYYATLLERDTNKSKGRIRTAERLDSQARGMVSLVAAMLGTDNADARCFLSNAYRAQPTAHVAPF